MHSEYLATIVITSSAGASSVFLLALVTIRLDRAGGKAARGLVTDLARPGFRVRAWLAAGREAHQVH